MTPQEQQRRIQEKARDYGNTFNPKVEFPISRWDLMRLAARAVFSRAPMYELTFCGRDGKPHPPAIGVLEDLRRVCRIDHGGLVVSPSGVVDSHASIYRAGQVDMYLRIVKFIELNQPGAGQ